MKKMVLLASLMALAALALAAAPAFAQDGGDGGFESVTICHRVGGPQEFQVITVDNEATLEGHLAHEGDIIPAPAGGCPDGDDGDGNGDGDGDGNGDNDNDNDNDGRDVFRNIGNVDVSPTIDISQDIDQDCDSGDVSQPVDVSQTGDNSIQTVGLQPTANTGCAQNATGILQAAPIVAGFGGDTLINNEDNGDDNGDDVDLIRCDRDGDGNDDGDDDCFVLVNDDNDNGDNGDREVFRNIGNDQVDINGPDFGDADVDSNASIDVSPALDVNGGGTINQTASAESNTFVVKPWPWWLK